MTYHDPCYLGRHNRVFDEPRGVLDAIPGVRTSRDGALPREGLLLRGGRRADVDGGDHRHARQPEPDRPRRSRTGADVVSTACPYCMIMLDDAVKAEGRGDDVRVLDISQVVEASLADDATTHAGVMTD